MVYIFTEATLARREAAEVGALDTGNQIRPRRVRAGRGDDEQQGQVAASRQTAPTGWHRFTGIQSKVFKQIFRIRTCPIKEVRAHPVREGLGPACDCRLRWWLCAYAC